LKYTWLSLNTNFFKNNIFKNNIFKNNIFKNNIFKNNIFKNNIFKNNIFKNNIFKLFNNNYIIKHNLSFFFNSKLFIKYNIFFTNIFLINISLLLFSSSIFKKNQLALNWNEIKRFGLFSLNNSLLINSLKINNNAYSFLLVFLNNFFIFFIIDIVFHFKTVLLFKKLNLLFSSFITNFFIFFIIPIPIFILSFNNKNINLINFEIYYFFHIINYKKKISIKKFNSISLN
jgi:hypothetical protein